MVVRSPGRWGRAVLAITSFGPAQPRLRLDRVVVGVRSKARSTSASRRAPLLLGQLEQHVVDAADVEGDEARGRLLGRHLHPRGGRVDALAEQVEVGSRLRSAGIA
jgi:hypothetical protein